MFSSAEFRTEALPGVSQALAIRLVLWIAPLFMAVGADADERVGIRYREKESPGNQDWGEAAGAGLGFALQVKPSAIALSATVSAGKRPSL
jgi:hypothetical protein